MGPGSRVRVQVQGQGSVMGPGPGSGFCEGSRSKILPRIQLGAELLRNPGAEGTKNHAPILSTKTHTGNRGGTRVWSLRRHFERILFVNLENLALHLQHKIFFISEKGGRGPGGFVPYGRFQTKA